MRHRAIILPSSVPHVKPAVQPALWGVDLGISNGAAIRLSSHGEPEVIAEWHKESSKFPTPVHALSAMTRRFAPVYDRLQVGDYLAIDWTLTEYTFGRTSVYQTSLKAFLAGHLYTSLISRGVYPVFLTPMEIRRALGLPANMKKELLHSAFRGDVGFPQAMQACFDAGSLDVRDALILADVLRRVPLLQLIGTPYVHTPTGATL